MKGHKPDQKTDKKGFKRRDARAGYFSVFLKNCYHLNPDKSQPFKGDLFLIKKAIFILKSLYIFVIRDISFLFAH